MGIKQRLVNLVAELYTWMANGQAHAAQLKYPFALAVAFKVFFPTASWLELLGWGSLALIIITFAGWFDLRFIQLHQRVAEIQTEKYNPYFKRLAEHHK